MFYGAGRYTFPRTAATKDTHSTRRSRVAGSQTPWKTNGEHMNPCSLAEAGRQLLARTVTSLELVEECLDRIRRYDDRVRAWVLVDEEGARRAAAAADEAITRGESISLLHGIPLGIKDIIDVAGWPTRAGSRLRENHRASNDAPLVASLRRAGAILLGKTVTVEFACFDPPPTRNPWDPALQHTPGGSSSGSAAAVAMGMCLGALGTQTGGSLVRPSTYCGIATCKPTFGRLPTDGVVPVSYHLDHPGPMARTVEDLKILLDHLPWSDQGLSRVLPGGLAPLAGQEDAAIRSLADQPTLGLVETMFLDEAQQSVRQATEVALDALRRGGARFERVTLPEGFREILPLHRRIMAVEAAAYHRHNFAAHRDLYGPMIAVLLDEGLATSAVDYAAALAHQREFQRRIGPLFDGFDALVMPSTDTTAPATLATTGNNRNQAPWSYLGVPVISIPCGLADDGMPVGLQLVQRHNRELELFRVAQWCEERLAFTALPPLLD